MSDLDKLIEAVEGGDAMGVDFICLSAAEHKFAYKAYHGSLDAAKSLHEALLPGWGYLLEWRDDNFVMAWLSPNLNNMTKSQVENAPNSDMRTYKHTPARAWLIAVLKAYRSQQC